MGKEHEFRVFRRYVEKLIRDSTRQYDEYMAHAHLGITPPAPRPGREVPGEWEMYEGRLQRVVDASRTGWWRFHEHYDRDGYCDNPARGY